MNERERQRHLIAAEHWIGMFSISVALGVELSEERILDHLSDVKNGVGIDYLDGDLTPAVWDELNLDLYPVIEFYGLHLAELARQRREGA